MPLILALVLVLGAGPAAGGEIFRWTDARGRVHFSQDIGKVPPKHRAAAREAAARRGPDPLQRYGDARPASRSRSSTRSLRPRPGRTLSIPFESQNHLMVVDVRLNDRVTATFLVDTGASLITLPRSVARQLQIQVGPDTRRERFSTANGDIWEPIIQLDSVQAGNARVENVEASISSSMDVGLLGGNFFNNFVYRVDAAAGRIELEVNDSVRGGYSQDQWQTRFRHLRGAVRRIDGYLASSQLSSAARAAELRKRRKQIASQLASLERDANALNVPRSWRY